MAMYQLGAQDASFLHMDSNNNRAFIMGINIYDPATAPKRPVRFKDIIRHLDSRVHGSPVFKRRLMKLPLDLDYPYWVEDEHFDIEHHITHCRLPEPGDWRQFCILSARHFSKPMDMNRPLWDMMVVEGLDSIAGLPEGAFALLSRAHHAAIDGVSGAYFFTAISDIDAMGTPAMKLPDQVDLGDTPSIPKIAGRAMFSNLVSPLKTARTMLQYSPDLWNTVQKFFMRQQQTELGQRAPKTRFNGSISPHRVYDAALFSLEDMKSIRRKAEGATLNDVVLAVVCGGLKNYLEHHDELPDEDIIASAPVNVRDKHNESDMGGNNISAMLVALPIHTPEPLDQLRKIQQITSSSKAAQSGLPARVMTDLTRHVPGVTLAGITRLTIRGRVYENFWNLIVSNVPGPQQPLYMCGAKKIRDYGMAPLLEGIGLFISTPSYNGSMSFNITSDRSLLPDVDFLRKCLEDAFAALLNAGVIKKKAAGRKSA